MLMGEAIAHETRVFKKGRSGLCIRALTPQTLQQSSLFCVLLGVAIS